MKRKITIAVLFVFFSFSSFGCESILYPKMKFENSSVFLVSQPIEGNIVGHFEGIIRILPLLKEYVVISKTDEMTCFYRVSEDNTIISSSSVPLDFELDPILLDSVKALEQGIFISHNYSSKTSVFFIPWNEDEISTIYEIPDKSSTRYYKLNLVDYIDKEMVLVFQSNFSGSEEFPEYNTVFVKFDADGNQTAFYEINNNNDIPHLYLYDYVLVDEKLFGLSRQSASDDLVIINFYSMGIIPRDCSGCSEGEPLWYIDDKGALNLFYIRNTGSNYQLVRETLFGEDFLPAQIVIEDYQTESYTDFEFSNGIIYNTETQGLRMEHETGDTFKSIILIDQDNQITYHTTETINSLGQMIGLSGRFISYNVLTGDIIEFRIDV